jgi:hypothetical protein
LKVSSSFIAPIFLPASKKKSTDGRSLLTAVRLGYPLLQNPSASSLATTASGRAGVAYLAIPIYIARERRVGLLCGAGAASAIKGTLDREAVAIEHVGVDHRRCQVPVPEKLLDSPDVVTGLRRCVANECFSKWIVAGLLTPLWRTASLNAY